MGLFKSTGSQAEDSMGNAFATVAVIVIVAVGLALWGVIALVRHFIR